MKSSFNFLLIRSQFILKALQKHKYLTREEISFMWADDDRSDGCEIDRCTFTRNISFIADTFRVFIKNKKINGKYCYYIANTEDLGCCQFLERAIASMAIEDILLYERNLHDRIVLEQFPSENGRLLPILKAMNASVCINLTYQKYNTDYVCKHLIQPYYIKEYHQRFYVVGKTERGGLIPFALDRIVTMKLTQEKFVFPDSFNAKEYFDTAFGVMVKGEPETIVLRASHDEAFYLKDVPPHHSQTVIHEDDDYTDFSYFLSPTNDFIGFILSRGDRLHVISPSFLADEVRQRHLNAASASL